MTFINEALYSVMARIQLKREEGASMAEYGLLVALIAAVCIGTITTLGTSINDKFSTVASAIGG